MHGFLNAPFWIKHFSLFINRPGSIFSIWKVRFSQNCDWGLIIICRGNIPVMGSFSKQAQLLGVCFRLWCINRNRIWNSIHRVYCHCWKVFWRELTACLGNNCCWNWNWNFGNGSYHLSDFAVAKMAGSYDISSNISCSRCTSWLVVQTCPKKKYVNMIIHCFN